MTKVAIFIDAWNFKYATYDSLDLRVDFVKLLEVLREEDYLLRAYYYTGIWTEDAIRSFVEMKKYEDKDARFQELLEKRKDEQTFHRVLTRSGYRVVTKPLQVYLDYKTGEVDIKADFDVEIAVGMLSLADKVDREILASGDGDFAAAVHAVADKGVRVAVLTTQSDEAYKRGYRPAEALLNAADDVILIEDIRKRIKRD